MLAAEARPAPEAFVATTVNVYEVPNVSPVTVQLVPSTTEQVLASGDEVTVYVIGVATPCVGVQDTVAFWSPATAATFVTAGGTFCGVTADDVAEFAEFPVVLTDFTVKVYAVPFVRPVTVHVSVGAMTVQFFDPGVEVTT